MKALLWKDCRLLMDVVWAALALFVASYLLVFLLIYSDSKSGFEWSKVVAGGASLTRFSSILICALAGSYAFAKEKEDKSLLFLQALPAGRPARL
jgi:ABC-type transport system involved in multi-copper enzyme maturation permease subunit